MLGAITYNNTSNNPSETDRLFAVQITDGDGTENDGVEISEASNVTISVSNVNVAPVIANLDGSSITFTENDAATVLDSSSTTTVSDGDSTDFEGGTLTVTLSNGTANDSLGVSSSSAFAFEDNGSNYNLAYDADSSGGSYETVIGTFNWLMAHLHLQSH